ncbi:MAG: metallophosphoesterase [Deltaproteobacteria bacterium]|nr:metallophosphoesterase [Deltaproteobacteria bacterium]
MALSDARTVFVISDLHIGGAYAAENGDDGSVAGRGFRICTRVPVLAEFVRSLPALAGGPVELVINGDFVDFLAEDHDGEFVSFISDEALAESVFLEIVERDLVLFEALRELVDAGHRVTILLGNHDIELAYPRVTAALIDVLGGPTESLSIEPYGQPLRIGDAWIEHGNRFDGFNTITAEQLARLVAGDGGWADLPPGSHLVATLMNPRKRELPFVDLLKPEQQAAIPVLLALDPTARTELGRLLLLKWYADRRIDARAQRGGLESMSSFDAGEDETDEPGPEDLIFETLAASLGGQEEAAEFLALIERDETEAERGLEPMSWNEALGSVELLLSSRPRITALWQALQALHRDLSFERSTESDPRYLDAIEAIPDARWVVMGHTHLAKLHEDILPGRTYLNSGTWADLIPFPEHILQGAKSEGIARLKQFLEDLRAGRTNPERLARWIDFRPTYVRLEYDGSCVTEAALEEYSLRSSLGT